MTGDEPSFTIGIEEEYLLVNRETRDLAADPPPELAVALEEALGSQVTSEFLRCQVETETVVCGSVREVRIELARLRTSVAECAAQFGLRRSPRRHTHLPSGASKKTPTRSATTL